MVTGERGLTDWGTEAYLARVEQWECDFNGHWNARFYGQAFDKAAAVLNVDKSATSSSVAAAYWHVRFHNELKTADLFSIHCSKIGGPTGDSDILHVLSTDGKVAATAIQSSICNSASLPDADQHLATLASPRGLSRRAFDRQVVLDEPQRVSPMGLPATDDLDLHGRLSLGSFLAYCGRASQAHFDSIGVGRQFARSSGTGCMLVELRVALFATVRADVPIRAVSSLSEVREKYFVTRHLFEGYDGTCLAEAELGLLMVDLTTRKATETPKFLRTMV